MTRKPKAGAEAPAAARRKAPRRTTAPPYPKYSFGWHAALFAAADIDALTSAAGLTLQPGADRSCLAIMLDRAITMAVTWHVPNARRPPPHRLLDFLRTVETQAQALMVTLGVPDNRAPGQPDDTADWFVHLDHGLSGPAPPSHWVSTWDDDHRNLYRRRAKKAVDALPDGSNGQDRERVMREAGSRAVLSVVPTALRTLAATARLAADRTNEERVAAERVAAQHGRTTRQTGRKRSVLNESRFDGLHRVHVAMFGRAPVTRDSVGDRSGPGVEWARLILQIAAQRIAGAAVHPDADVIAAVKAVARLSDSRIADLLESARTPEDAPGTPPA